MRKIGLFFILLTGILLSILFTSVGVALAQRTPGFNHAGSDNDAKIPYCQNNECSIENGLDSTKTSLNNQVETEKSISEYIQDIVSYLLTFVSVVAVIYVIWAGFQILTGNGEDDKLKSAKKTIVFVILGIIVMWLAYSIIGWVMKIISGNNTAYLKDDHSKSFLAYIIPQANAQGAYTENEVGTFAEYKSRIQAAIENLETDLRINNKVQATDLHQIRSLINSADRRLPDRDPKKTAKNESAKRAVDLYIGIALNNLNSQQKVGQAISQIANYINSAQIETVQGSISATPTEGNAPLTTSFRAQNVQDPSGTIPPAVNYIWWVRENGGVRRELGRGPTLTKTFTKEGTYTIFLDVMSASRNSKGMVDVLPLSTSVPIEVKPRIGEIVLLVNGINVSNLQTLKLSPAITKQGIIFDASASRAIGNGIIEETSWNFENGNSKTYKGAPAIEREIFATEGRYSVSLKLKLNNGQTITKDIQLIIVDPAASIKTSKDTAHVGEELSFQAESHLGNNIRNIEYVWQVQDEQGKRTIKTSNGNTFSHTFESIGTYIVTLTAKKPDGGIDNDSKVIVVESRDPIATLDVPQMINSEHPNTFTFNASRSYDSDTNSKKGLTYTWRINDQKVTLDNINADGDKGTFTFNQTGPQKVSVTVANQYGKIATAEQNFNVTSILSGDITISPQVSQGRKDINFVITSKNADFIEWNFGDGSPVQSGNKKAVKHSYEKTGVYTMIAKLIQNGNSQDYTTISRKVYITDMDSPFSMITVSNSTNSTIEEPGICNGNDAYVLNRAETSTLDGTKSINVDGNTTNLDYTWRYMGKVSTNPTISEIFRDLGCFPIELTVRSKTTGAKHVSKKYIQLKNQPPELTNIAVTVDSNKKDSQKILVKATANGVNDPDGVITSYTWFYTTESDPEPQSIQITQQPQMTFVLPNVTEKYHFGVILEDNDGARINSMDLLQKQVPLLIDNANGNINMPLISMTVPNKAVKAGEQVRFGVTAKTIIGNNITEKSQYAWDFDGDGRIDQKTVEPAVTHVYTKAGDYNMKVRVTYNGVSNTKYHTVHVRNELKASFQGYKIPGERLYLMNTSQGVYDKVKWTLGKFESNQKDSVVVDFIDLPRANKDGSIGTLTVSNNDTDISTVNILLRDLETVNNENGVTFQSFPKIDSNNTIIIKDSLEPLKLSFYGNDATNFAVDINTDVDSNLDGITDNDIDNKETSSYENGGVFTISDFSNARKRERNIKITLYKESTPIDSRTIQVVLDFIPENKTIDINKDQNLSELNDFDREKLEELATIVRGLPDAERIIIMQKYNILVENWENSFEKAKTLLDIQTEVTNGNISEEKKQEISKIIDSLLIGDAQTINQITIATKLIRDLIPQNSPNYQALIEKIDAIASHPDNTSENKKLGKKILTLIKDDPAIEDTYKIHIRNQLLIITEQGELPDTQIVTQKPKKNGGILGIFGAIFKVFLIIIGIFLGILLIVYIIYAIGKKDGDIGFQDYIIDTIFHRNKKKNVEDNIPPIAKPIIQKKEEKQEVADIDPLKAYTPPEEVTPISSNEEINNNDLPSEVPQPSWLQPQQNDTTPNMTENPLSDQPNNTLDTSNLQGEFDSQENLTEDKNLSSDTSGLPDWLNPQQQVPSVISQNTISDPLAASQYNNSTDNIESTFGSDKQSNINDRKNDGAEQMLKNNNTLPDWLQPVNSTNNNADTQEQINPKNTNTPFSGLDGLDTTNNSEISTEKSSNTIEDTIESSNPNDSISGNETMDSKDESPTQDLDESKIDQVINNQQSTFSYTQTKDTVTTPLKNNEIPTDSIPQINDAFDFNIPKNTDQNPKNDEIPDWLQGLSDDPLTPVDDIENTTTADIINTSSSKEEEKLPDWLLASANNSEISTEKSSNTIEDTIESSNPNDSISGNETMDSKDAIKEDADKKISEIGFQTSKNLDTKESKKTTGSQKKIATDKPKSVAKSSKKSSTQKNSNTKSIDKNSSSNVTSVKKSTTSKKNTTKTQEKNTVDTKKNIKNTPKGLDEKLPDWLK